MTTVSLSALFNKQIKSVDKIEAVRVTNSFRRIARMIDGLQEYNLDVTQMTLKIKVGRNLAVVVKVIPSDTIIAKKIVKK